MYVQITPCAGVQSEIHQGRPLVIKAPSFNKKRYKTLVQNLFLSSFFKYSSNQYQKNESLD